MTEPLAAPPRRSGPAWGKILGFGCGGCTLVVLLIALLFASAFRQLLHKTPLPPAALPYAGDWQAQDGTTLSIRADGSGRYHGGNTTIDGGQVKIDPATRTLEIGLFGIKKRCHIDQKPRSVRRTTILRLVGMVYWRTSWF